MRTGYRFFQCEDCGTEWKTACRDVTSPSGEHCPDEECEFQPMAVPYRYEVEEMLTDNHGNLLHEHTEIIEVEPPPNVAMMMLVRNFGIAAQTNEYVKKGTLLRIDDNGNAVPINTKEACHDLARQLADEMGAVNSEEFHNRLKEDMLKLLSPVLPDIPKYDIRAIKSNDGMSVEIKIKPEYAYSRRDSIRDRKNGLFPSPINEHPIDIAVVEDILALKTAPLGFGIIIFDSTHTITVEIIVSEYIKRFYDQYGYRVGSPEYWNMLVKAKAPFDFDTHSEKLVPLVADTVNELSSVYRRRHKRLPSVQIDMLNDCCRIKLS